MLVLKPLNRISILLSSALIFIVTHNPVFAGLASIHSLPSDGISNVSYYVDESVEDKDLLINSLNNCVSTEPVIHLFAHGRSGELFIHNKWINAKEIGYYLEVNLLTGSAGLEKLYIYGCEFAKGKKGMEAVSYLENFLNVSIAASDDITGISGDWHLEVGDVNFKIKNGSYNYNLQKADSRISPNLLEFINAKNNKKDIPERLNNELIKKDDRILVDIVAENTLEKTISAVQSLDIETTSAYGRIISTWVNADDLERLENMKEVHLVRMVPKNSVMGNIGDTQTSAVGSDGFTTIFDQCSLLGSGVKIAAISDSYNTLGGEADGIASGDLPGAGNPDGYTTPVNVLEELTSTGIDEGRAMIEIIHDLAPAAEKLFHTGTIGAANYATGIQDLVDAGANAIVSDIFYATEPFFQDGIISQAFESAVTQGVSAIQHAGNFAVNSYESSFRPSGIFFNGEEAHDFNPGAGTDIRQTIKIDFNSSFLLTLQWDDPWFSVSGMPGANTDVNIYMVAPGSNTWERWSRFNNINNGDPLEWFSWNNGNNINTYEIIITKRVGPNPGKIKYLMTNPWVSGIDEYASNSGTIVGSQSSPGMVSVGGTVKSDPSNTYIYSSEGGSAILFDNDGNELATPVVRDFPTILAPQAVNTTFFGVLGVDDLEGDGFPNFWGTSASSPHVAGLAALVYQCDASITPAQFRQALIDNAIDPNAAKGFAPYDTKTGYGYWNPEAVLIDLCGPCAAALPIELLSFIVKKERETAQLKWITSSEVNNDYFDIERSYDGRNFEVIGRVKGSGTTTLEQTYTYTDVTPKMGVNYYRIRQADYDGKTEISQMKNVVFNKNDLGYFGDISIFPNPTHDNITLTSNSDFEYHKVRLINTVGKLITEESYRSGMIINLDEYSAGAYILQTIDQSGGVVYSDKIVKL